MNYSISFLLGIIILLFLSACGPDDGSTPPIPGIGQQQQFIQPPVPQGYPQVPGQIPGQAPAYPQPQAVTGGQVPGQVPGQVSAYPQPQVVAGGQVPAYPQPPNVIGGTQGPLPIANPAASHAPKIPGFIYIPPSTVYVGTPIGELPRCAYSEMQGTPVSLGGFYIHEYPVPGPGKPPYMNVTWSQAKQGCESIGARLCSEIEWERACKGVDNSKYPYGSKWNPSICAVADKGKTQPHLGAYPGCVTEEGVHDMIGNVWEWTSDTWGIPGKHQSAYVLRGGHKSFGRIASRCSHRYRMAHDKVSPKVGYRCCKGPVNTARVTVAHNKPETKFVETTITQAMLRSLKQDFPKAGINFKYKNVQFVNPQWLAQYGFDTAVSGESEVLNWTRQNKHFIWQPTSNANIYVFNLRYETTKNVNGGGLLVFAEKDNHNNMRIMAAFARPNKNDNPLVYVAPVNDYLLNVVFTWNENGQRYGLSTKVSHDCGSIKLKVIGETATTKYPKPYRVVKSVKALYDLKKATE